jgi:hypothetical protein
VFSQKVAANEKNPPRESLGRNACAKCGFLIVVGCKAYSFWMDIQNIMKYL